MDGRDQSLTARWAIDGDHIPTPRAAERGPNQILLRQEYFPNSYVEAVVQPLTLQPYLDRGKEARLEGSLVGRFHDHDDDVTAVMGVHGRDFAIARVEGGRFEMLEKLRDLPRFDDRYSRPSDPETCHGRGIVPPPDATLPSHWGSRMRAS